MSREGPFLFLKATGLIYLDCANRATQGLRRNWRLMIAALAAYVLVHTAGDFLSPYGLAGGLVLGMISIALLSMYFGWIADTVRGQKIVWRDLLQFDRGLFSDTLSTAFLLFLITWPFEMMQGASQDVWLLLCLRLGLVIVFNAVPEVVHQRRLDGVSALLNAARFTRDNWIEWFVPLAVLVAPLLVILPSYFLVVLASSEPMLPVLVIVRSWQPLGQYAGAFMGLAGLILGHWFMLFRAHLFNELEGGSRRKRIYQAKLK